MGEQQVAEVGELEPARGEPRLQVRQRARGAAVEERRPVGGLEQVAADHPLVAEVVQVDQVQARAADADERGLEVGDQVVGRLDPDREADELGGGAVGALDGGARASSGTGCSIRLSTPPSLSASWKIFVRATSATASSSEPARNETIPPKSRIWRAASSWPGATARPGVEHPLDRGCPSRNSATARAFSQCRSHPQRERLDPAQDEPAVERARHRAERLLQEREPLGERRVVRRRRSRRRRRSGRRGTSSSSGRRCRRRARAGAGGTGVAKVLSTTTIAPTRVRRLGDRADVDDVQQRVRRRLDPDELRPLVDRASAIDSRGRRSRTT